VLWNYTNSQTQRVALNLNRTYRSYGTHGTLLTNPESYGSGKKIPCLWQFECRYEGNPMIAVKIELFFPTTIIHILEIPKIFSTFECSTKAQK